MIPAFDSSGNLPPGIHEADWDDIHARLGRGARRQHLLCLVLPALTALRDAGCGAVYLAGSFVSAKDAPSDIDILWDTAHVDRATLIRLEPLLADARPDQRCVQQSRFGAEFIPLDTPRAGLSFLEFFQTVKETDLPRGIVRLNLDRLPSLA